MNAAHAILFASFAALPAAAAVQPNSLRLVRGATAIDLTWVDPTPPSGVFRALAAQSLRADVNKIADAATPAYADPIAGLPADLYFYQVGDASLCETNPDCDDGIACTDDVCTATGCTNLPFGLGTRAEIAGNPLLTYPWFEYVRAFNVDAPIAVALDPSRFSGVATKTCDVYVLAARGLAGWCADASLVDVRGVPDTRVFPASGMQASTFPLTAPGALSPAAGLALGAGYDVVLDCDRDGRLGPADFIDGLGDEAGLYVMPDLAATGPLPTSSFEIVGPLPPWPGPWTDEGDDLRVYYPQALDDPAFTGTFPLVVVSHGNGHRYSWYDFLGFHLASWGYIVLAHDNNTSPGIHTASLSTLRFTDKILLEQATLGGGVLDGHIDAAEITWIGHSRGGEGVARAYTRMRNEGWVPLAYSRADIALVSSIAPTDYWGFGQSNAYEVNYALLFGSADGDVSGCAIRDDRDSFDLYERAAGTKASAYVHGADHNDFNCCGFDDFTGPAGTAVGRPEAQQVQKAFYLALIKHFIDGDLPAKDFLWRQNESLRPIGVAATTIIDREYRDADGPAIFIVDDYESQPATTVSSSGAQVQSTVDNLVEDLMTDGNTTFTWSGSEPMNGMTRANTDQSPPDVEHAAVFDWSVVAPAAIDFEIAAVASDFTGYTYLSLRACQGTRHPATIAELADLTFDVVLRDSDGDSGRINIGAYGGGIEEPYQRTSCGTGAGWQNEFEVIRIRLTDFLHDNPGLNLQSIATIALEFGGAGTSIQGRLGLDDILLTKD